MQRPGPAWKWLKMHETHEFCNPLVQIQGVHPLHFIESLMKIGNILESEWNSLKQCPMYPNVVQLRYVVLDSPGITFKCASTAAKSSGHLPSARSKIFATIFTFLLFESFWFFSICLILFDHVWSDLWIFNDIYGTLTHVDSMIDIYTEKYIKIVKYNSAIFCKCLPSSSNPW